MVDESRCNCDGLAIFRIPWGAMKVFCEKISGEVLEFDVGQEVTIYDLKDGLWRCGVKAYAPVTWGHQ